MDNASLRYTEGTSDKVYQAEIAPAGDLYVVNFAYGRYGSTLQTGSKTSKPVPYAKAKAIFDKLISEKTGKGYQFVGTAAVAFTGAGNGKQQTGIKPQLLNPVESSQLELYFTSDWLMQEKMDGERRMIRVKNGAATGINRKGEVVPLPQVIANAVLALWANDILLDGEQVGSIFHCFDLLEMSGEDLRSQPCYERLSVLFGLYRDAFGETGDATLKTVLTWGTEKGKRKAFAKIQAERGEGVVFKDRDAPYTAGRPNSGGAQVKFKFTATATVKVWSERPDDKRSVKVSVRHQEEGWRPIGRVTIPVNQPIPEEGDFVEVRYLYAYPGGSLYQPVYLGARPDKDTADDYSTLKLRQGTTEEEEN